MLSSNQLVACSGSVRQKLYDIAQQSIDNIAASGAFMDMLVADGLQEFSLTVDQVKLLHQRMMLLPDGTSLQFTSQTVGSTNKLFMYYSSKVSQGVQSLSVGGQGVEGGPYIIDVSTLLTVLDREHPDLDIEDLLDDLTDQIILSELLIDLSVAANAGQFNPGMIYSKYANRGIASVQQVIDAVAVVASTGEPSTIFEAIRSGMQTWTEVSQLEEDSLIPLEFWEDYETSSWTSGLWKSAKSITQGVGSALMTVGGPMLKVVGTCISGATFLVDKLLDRVYDIPVPTYNSSSGDTFYHAMIGVEDSVINDDQTLYHPEFAAWYSSGRSGLAVRSSPNSKILYTDIVVEDQTNPSHINPYTLKLDVNAWSSIVSEPSTAGRRYREFLSKADTVVWDPDRYKDGPMFNWEANGANRDTWLSTILYQCIGYWRSYIMLHRFVQSWSLAAITAENYMDFRYPTSSSFYLRNKISGVTSDPVLRTVGSIEDALEELTVLILKGETVTSETVLTPHMEVGHLCDFDGLRDAIKAVSKYKRSVSSSSGFDASFILPRLPLFVTSGDTIEISGISLVDILDNTWFPFFTPPEYSPKDFIIMRVVQTTAVVTVAALSAVAAVKARKALTRLRYKRQLRVDQRRAAYLADPSNKDAQYKYARSLSKLNAGSIKTNSNGGVLNNLIGANSPQQVEWTTDDALGRIYSAITGL